MSATILIADDDPSVVLLMKENLSAEGYQVLEAYDGDSALAIARTSHPQLILLDMNMPGLSGYQVLQSLRAEAKTKMIPVVFLTGDASTQVPIELRGLSGVVYLAKTVPLDELNKRIAGLVKMP